MGYTLTLAPLSGYYGDIETQRVRVVLLEKLVLCLCVLTSCMVDSNESEISTDSDVNLLEKDTEKHSILV